MSPLNRYVCDRGRQCGAIGLLAAITLALAALCMLVVVDSGRLFLEKRSLQRVADVAALEAASRKGNCLVATGVDKQATTYASQSAIRNGFTAGTEGRTLATHCGSLALDANSRRIFTADSSKTEAIQVTVSHNVPRSIAAGIGAMFDTTPIPVDIQLSATAVAKGPPQLPPLARLTIKSTLANIATQDEANLLNLLWGGLLGGTLDLSIAGWNGLLNTDLNLLSYLDQLAIDAGIKAGDYATLLSTDITVRKLLETSLKVLPQNASAAQLAINNLLRVSAIPAGTSIKLADLLRVQNGTSTAALDLNMNLFQLVEGFVQVANSDSALFASIPINVPNVATVTAKIKVIEPPQLSALGNPNLATTNPQDPNQIYVRTASIRTLLRIDLTGAVNSLLQGVSTVLSAPLGLLGADIKVAPKGLNVDLSLEVATADSHVVPGSTCASEETKTLKVETTTAAVKVKLGQLTPASASAWNSPSTNVVMGELPLLDIGTVTCVPLVGCQPRVPYGGGGLGLYIGGSNATDGSIAFDKQPYTYLQPPGIDLPPTPFHSFDSSNVVGSLGNTLSAIKVVNHPAVTPGLLSSVLGLISSTLNGVTSVLVNVVGGILSSLLDPLLNTVLKSLGINLAEVSVGANLTCNPIPDAPVAELVI